MILAVVTTLLGAVLVGCSSGSDPQNNQVSGVVTEVSTDETTVVSFVVMDDQRKSHLFIPAPGLVHHGGPLTDLRDHVITGQRVTVTFTSEDRGEKVATAVEHEDAGSPHQVPETSSPR